MWWDEELERISTLYKNLKRQRTCSFWHKQQNNFSTRRVPSYDTIKYSIDGRDVGQLQLRIKTERTLTGGAKIKNTFIYNDFINDVFGDTETALDAEREIIFSVYRGCCESEGRYNAEGPLRQTGESA